MPCPWRPAALLTSALCIVLGLLAIGPPAHAARGKRPPVRVQILALNDFHGQLTPPSASEPVGGIDVLASHIAAARVRNPNTVVVSAGDLIGASPLVSALFHDEGSIETLNRAGLDFNAVGNHEFDEGRDELLRMQRGGCHPTDPSHSCQGERVGTPVPFEGARFRFLAANVVDTASGHTLLPSFGIKTFQRVRVGFIGMTLKATPDVVSPSGITGLDFRDEAATVNALVPVLRARGVQAIVVLIHQGGRQTAAPDRVDINACVGDLDNADGSGPSPIKRIVGQLDNAVDVVISGHTHAAYNCRLPLASGRRIPVTSAQSQGRVLTEISLTLDGRSGHVLASAAVNKVVDRGNTAITPDAAIARIVSGYETLAAPIAHSVIGRITKAVPQARDAACNMPAGELIADAQWQATATRGAAQLALMNPGGVRAPGFTYPGNGAGEDDGQITYGEAFAVQPFGNSLVTLTLTAQQLKEVLAQQFSGCQIPGHPVQTADRILLPSAGFRFSWDASLPPCDRVREVSLDGRVLVQDGVVRSPSDRYRVTVNSFLADGGDGFTVLKDGLERVGGGQDLDALGAYLSAYQAPLSAYDPESPALGKPRIIRLDHGTTCP